MKDADCVTFLQWALPRMGLRWQGYRNVRGQVCKRLRRRVAALGLADLAAYRARLDVDAGEWEALRGLCGVTISRFYRDRGVWEGLRDEVLPALAERALHARESALRCWSLGCASGEEPYTLAIVWELALASRYPALGLRVLATDANERVLARAALARYELGSVRELPAGFREAAFEREGDTLSLRQRFRSDVELRRQDVRRDAPGETFRLVLCRNLVFTYFDEAEQARALERVVQRLAPGGALVLGRHEQLPACDALEPWRPALGIYRRAPGAA